MRAPRLLSTEEQYADIFKRLERIEKVVLLINRKLSEEAKRTRTWVGVSIIQELTGWNSNGMRRARENGLVQMRKSSKGIEYLLESIHPMFLKNPPANEPL